MGMLMEGRWVDEAERLINDGVFVREARTFDVDLDIESMRTLDAAGGTDRHTLVPSHLAPDIDVLNRRIHERLANALYRVGLAQRQAAYDEATASAPNLYHC